jgi:hypothetical protein
MFIVIAVIGGAPTLFFHAELSNRIPLLFTMSRLDFAGEFRR